MDAIPQLQKQGQHIMVASTSDGKHIITFTFLNATNDLQL